MQHSNQHLTTAQSCNAMQSQLTGAMKNVMKAIPKSSVMIIYHWRL